MALLLPPRMRAVETGLRDAVRQHLGETGFDDVDVAMDGQLVEVRWHGDPARAGDAAMLHDDLSRAAREAATARPNDWPFPRNSDWSDWATAPVIAAVADQASVPNLPPPPPIVATEDAPRPAVTAVAVSASASAAANCTDAVAAAISGRRLHFISSSAELTRDGDAVLDTVYKVVRGCPAGLSLEIDGYTDDVGPARANLTLSFERARAAAAALVRRGMPQDMVNAHGFGPQDPVASNSTGAGRAANRRVVFVLRPG